MQISKLVLLYVYYHPGSTIAEIEKHLSVNPDSCRSLLGNMKQKHLCTSDNQRPRHYFCDSIEATSEELDEYAWSILAKMKCKTLDELRQVSGLSLYQVSRTIRRLKTLGKITTMTGHGITVLHEPLSHAKKAWTTREIKFLIENAGRIPARELAEKLGRTVRAIHQCAMRNGVTVVTRRCSVGHYMTERPSGVWVCNVCHTKRREKNEARYQTLP